MGVSAFQIIAENSGAFNVNDPFFPVDVNFPDAPAETVQAVQVQIQTDQPSTLQVTLDGVTWIEVNNGIAISGIATFTMLVASDSNLNFRNADVPGLGVAIVVAA